MKTKKMSLASIKDVLSREEMKNIMAGSGPGDQCGICFGPGGSATCANNWNNSCQCLIYTGQTCWK